MINEIDDSAATPLQAVKLLALYLSSPANKVWAFDLKEFNASCLCLDHILILLVLFEHLSDHFEVIEILCDWIWI